MASVAVCPHCFLQLAIGDEIASDSHVECPTCHKQFDLALAVLRSIPEALPVVRSTVSAKTVAELETRAFDELANQVRRDSLEEDPGDVDEEELPETDTVVGETVVIEDMPLEAKTPADGEIAAPTDLNADELAVEEELNVPPRTKTLAEIMAERAELDEEEEAEPFSAKLTPGPSFDLPNVPLVRDNGGTVEFGSLADIGTTSNTEFELDNVDFEISPESAQPTEEVETYADEPSFEPAASLAAAADSPRFGGEELPDTPFIVGAPPQRRRRSVGRMLVGAMLGGFMGLAAGYYLLMYLLGPSGDFLHVARFVPSPLLPASFERRQPPMIPPMVDIPSAPPVAEAPAPLEENELPQELAPAKEEPATVADSGPVSENIPAGYLESNGAPIEGGESEDLLADEADTSAPAAFEDPLAEALPTTPIEEPKEPMPFPLTGPSYTASELETALASAELAEPGLVDGDLSDSTVRRTKGLSYAKLCDLANTLVFAKLNTEMSGEQDLQSRATQLFADVLSTPHTRDEVARIASIWAESPHRKHGGIFLAGVVSDGQIAGDLYEYKLQSEDGATYALLTSQPIELMSDGANPLFAIVGTIVDEPSVNVAGYTGTAPRAIYAAHALPLK